MDDEDLEALRKSARQLAVMWIEMVDAGMPEREASLFILGLASSEKDAQKDNLERALRMTTLN